MNDINFRTENLNQQEIERLQFVGSRFIERRRELLRKNSPSESHFEKLLKDAHIYYVREKCFFDRNGEWCYIDFYIPLYHIGIEIDGKEHSTQKQMFRDSKKTEFLLQFRKVNIIRITNEQCLALKSISLVDIVKHPDIKDSVNYRIDSLRKHYIEHAFVYVRNYILTYKKVFVYDKIRKAIFYFKSPYSFHMSLGCNYKEFIDIMTCIQDPFRNSRFIIGYSEEALKYYMNIYIVNDGVKPDGFRPIVYMRKYLPVPIFKNYMQRDFSIIILDNSICFSPGVVDFITLRLIDNSNNEIIYDKIYKFNRSTMNKYLLMANALEIESICIPIHSRLTVYTRNGGFSNYIYFGISEDNLDCASRNRIQNVLNGKGIDFSMVKIKRFKGATLEAKYYVEKVSKRLNRLQRKRGKNEGKDA